MTLDTAPDLLVVGGGAGGLSAARAAARRGARVVLVEAGRLGGDCTFTGCVPSKTLLEAAWRGSSFTDAMAAMHAAVERIAAAEDDTALRREGVEVVHGWARFTAPGTIDIDGTTWRPQRTVLATGGRPVIPSVPGFADVPVLTNESVFGLDHQPRRLAIVGGGAIGCELAQAFQRFGTSVTLLEAADRVVASEEPAASDVVDVVLRREGVDVRTATKVLRAASAPGGTQLHLDGGDLVEVDAVLAATGRAASVEGLDLDAAGVAVVDGAVKVDRTLATTAPGVWAVGDVTGLVQLTHAADEMGRIAVASALTRRPRQRFRPEQIPSVIFTSPEVARIGPVLATLEGQPHRVAHLPMSAVDRAITADATDGFVQLIAGPRPLLRNAGGGRLLGATVVAPRAGEMISELALALRTGMFVGRLAQTVHPYPTWSVALRQAAAQFFMEVDGRRAR